MKLPGVCNVCRSALFWNGKYWRDPNQRAGRHRCGDDRPTCGVRMKCGDRCARRPGHTTEHRTAYALDNARVARTGRAA